MRGAAGVSRLPARRSRQENGIVNTYRLHIRSDEFEYEHEIRATEVEKEDGWTIFWSGNDVFMRIRDDHIVSLEHLI